MTFAKSILLLVSICLFVALPYGVGHGIASHNNTAILIGVVCGAAALGLFFLQKGFDRGAH